jgi:hypothetical protein
MFSCRQNRKITTYKPKVRPQNAAKDAMFVLLSPQNAEHKRVRLLDEIHQIVSD